MMCKAVYSSVRDVIFIYVAIHRFGYTQHADDQRDVIGLETAYWKHQGTAQLLLHWV